MWRASRRAYCSKRLEPVFDFEGDELASLLEEVVVRRDYAIDQRLWQATHLQIASRLEASVAG